VLTRLLLIEEEEESAGVVVDEVVVVDVEDAAVDLGSTNTFFLPSSRSQIDSPPSPPLLPPFSSFLARFHTASTPSRYA